MILRPAVRKLALTAHVTCSVGWLGAVVAFLGLAVVGMTSQDPQTVRGVYLVMEPAARFALIPLAFASLVFKLVISVFATVILLFYMETFGHLASVAADPTSELEIVRNSSPVLHAVLALLVLLVATVLAVYKPQGVTPYGLRKQREPRASS